MSPASRVACLLLLSLCAASCVTAQSSTTHPSASLSSLPLQFEPNHGQVTAPVLYQARGAGHGVFFTKEAVMIAARAKTHGAALKMRFVNENEAASFAPFDLLPGKSNYLRSKDPSSWVTNIPTYARLSKRSIYPGVDAVFYGAGNRLEYDLHVAPGADAKQIVLAFEGADHLALNAHGDLVIRSGDFVFTQHRPVTYQFQNGKRHTVPSNYKMLAGNRVAFEVGPYHKTKELIIDPQLVYSSYFGGKTASEYSEEAGGFVDHPATNSGSGIKTDASGNPYVLGYTNAYDFPLTPGAYSTTVADQCGDPPACYPSDSFLMKLNPSGQVIFATYVGVQSEGFDIDGDGNSYMVSYENAGREGIYGVQLVAINNTGTALLGWHSYDMGNPTIGGIRADANKNAFIAGTADPANFSTTSGAFQSSTPRCNSGACGSTEGFVMKVDSITGNVLYATLLGGNGDDSISALTTDSIGNAFVAGNTESTDFPHTRTFGSGTLNTFVAKLNATGSALHYSDLFSGAIPTAMTLDSTNHAYVTGEVTAFTFPTTSNAYDRTYAGGNCPPQGTAYRTCYDGFFTRFSIDGSAIQYSTIFGGGYDDDPSSVVVDSSGTAWIGGSTQSGSFPTTSDAFDRSYANVTCFSERCFDGFLIAFTSSGTLKYSTYFGGTSWDTVNGVAVDPSKNVWLTGLTYSTDLPTTSNAPYRSRPGNSGAFVAKFSQSSSTTTCNPPSTAGVNICSPAAGSTVSSPVRILAAAKTTNTTVRMELWIDGTKKTTVTGNKLDYSATLGKGIHLISVYGIDSGGSKVNKKINITVN
jgi:hypothetical protein